MTHRRPRTPLPVHRLVAASCLLGVLLLGHAGGAAIAREDVGAATAPFGVPPGTDGRCGEEQDTWAFHDDVLRRLSARGDFQGWCNPGEGLVTRTYVTPGWRGDAVVNTGYPGGNFWIDWSNAGAEGGPHAEFDISIARDLWQGADLGYGDRSIGSLREAEIDLTLTARGSWAQGAHTPDAAPEGKSHVQVIIWLTREAGADANAGLDENGACIDRQSVDITVVQWLPEALRENYLGLVNVNPTTRWVASVDDGGASYEVYAREPGDICEAASYLAIRAVDGFGLEPASVAVDAGAFLGALIDDAPFDESWFIAALGWEITGASADQSDARLGDSAGKFVFECYSIPSLVDRRTGPGHDRCE